MNDEKHHSLAQSNELMLNNDGFHRYSYVIQRKITGSNGATMKNIVHVPRGT